MQTLLQTQQIRQRESKEEEIIELTRMVESGESKSAII